MFSGLCGYFKVSVNVQVEGTYTTSSESILTMPMTKDYRNEKAECSMQNTVFIVSVHCCVCCHPSPLAPNKMMFR